MVTEVLGGGKFYVQTVGDQKVASIQRQVASLNLQEAPLVGAFNPRKGDTVLAQFSADNSWNRAMVSGICLCQEILVIKIASVHSFVTFSSSD